MSTFWTACGFEKVILPSNWVPNVRVEEQQRFLESFSSVFDADGFLAEDRETVEKLIGRQHPEFDHLLPDHVVPISQVNFEICWQSPSCCEEIESGDVFEAIQFEDAICWENPQYRSPVFERRATNGLSVFFKPYGGDCTEIDRWKENRVKSPLEWTVRVPMIDLKICQSLEFLRGLKQISPKKYVVDAFAVASLSITNKFDVETYNADRCCVSGCPPPNDSCFYAFAKPFLVWGEIGDRVTFLAYLEKDSWIKQITGEKK